MPGLRGEEVALSAGVSVEYNTRLERGGLAGASDSVLDALVGAPQLDEAERGHLCDLARDAARATGQPCPVLLPRGRAHRLYPDWQKPPRRPTRSCTPRPVATRPTSN